MWCDGAPSIWQRLLSQSSIQLKQGDGGCCSCRQHKGDVQATQPAQQPKPVLLAVVLCGDDRCVSTCGRTEVGCKSCKQIGQLLEHSACPKVARLQQHQQHTNLSGLLLRVILTIHAR